MGCVQVSRRVVSIQSRSLAKTALGRQNSTPGQDLVEKRVQEPV